MKFTHRELAAIAHGNGIAEEIFQRIDAPWQLDILAVAHTRYCRYIVVCYLGNIIENHWFQQRFIAAAQQERSLQAHYGIHRIGQGILALLHGTYKSFGSINLLFQELRSRLALAVAALHLLIEHTLVIVAHS